MRRTKIKNLRLRCIYLGVTALAVISGGILLAFLLMELEKIGAGIRRIITILQPVIYGAVLAYLFLPVYNKSRNGWNQKIARLRKSREKEVKTAKAAARVICLLLLFVVLVGLCSIILPQIYESMKSLQASMEQYVENLALWLQEILKNNPDYQKAVLTFYNQAAEQMENWLNQSLIPHLTVFVSELSKGVFNVVAVLKNMLIGIIVMVYLLNIKDTLAAQGRKILYRLLGIKGADWLIEEICFTHKVFGNFITGKLLDSLIIGILCFIGMTIFRMPYVLLISVIIGVTNVIPFFGPFIGAIPSAFLILLVSLMQCLYFLFFVLVLQQFDGNILGPKILGDSTGLPSFWILFSILLFEGLWGFVGMIIAVPLFAVIYRLTAKFIRYQLRKRGLPLETEAYGTLQRYEEKTKEPDDRR